MNLRISLFVVQPIAPLKAFANWVMTPFWGFAGFDSVSLFKSGELRPSSQSVRACRMVFAQVEIYRSCLDSLTSFVDQVYLTWRTTVAGVLALLPRNLWLAIQANAGFPSHLLFSFSAVSSIGGAYVVNRVVSLTASIQSGPGFMRRSGLCVSSVYSTRSWACGRHSDSQVDQHLQMGTWRWHEIVGFPCTGRTTSGSLNPTWFVPVVSAWSWLDSAQKEVQVLLGVLCKDLKNLLRFRRFLALFCWISSESASCVCAWIGRLTWFKPKRSGRSPYLLRVLLRLSSAIARVCRCITTSATKEQIRTDSFSVLRYPVRWANVCSTFPIIKTQTKSTYSSSTLSRSILRSCDLLKNLKRTEPIWTGASKVSLFTGDK